MNDLLPLVLFSALAVASAAPASAAHPASSPHQHSSDSPPLAFTRHTVENFADSLTSTPGVLASTTSVSLLRADISRGSYLVPDMSVTVTFDPLLPGVLPTHGRIVQAGGGFEIDHATASARQLWFDTLEHAGPSLGALPAVALGGRLVGGPQERFSGAVHAAAAPKIALPDHAGLERDHRQYGASALRAPEMSTLAMLFAGFSLLAFSLLRRSQ